MSKLRLFLHVGTHKTGTTSIQFLLADNQQKIADAGMRVIVDPPGAAGHATNCASIAHAFVRQRLWTPSRMGTPGKMQFGDALAIQHFLRQMQGGGFDSAILSAEALCYLRTQEELDSLRTCLAKLDCEVVPLVYLRNPEDWHASWSAWLNKLDYVQAFRQRHPDQFRLLDDWYFNRPAICAFWSQIGAVPVFIDYDKAMARHGSVIPSFLHVLGLPATLDNERYFLNQRCFRGVAH